MLTAVVSPGGEVPVQACNAARLGAAAWPAWPDYPFTGSAYKDTIYPNQNGDAMLTGRPLTAGEFDGYQICWGYYEYETATIETTGSTDTRLAFYDGPGSPDLTDNDSGEGSNARIRTDLPEEWTGLGICVCGYGASATGEYELLVDGPQPEILNSIQIDENRHGSHSGQISGAGRYDLYPLETTAAGDWTVRVSPAGSWDPTLLVFDDAGNPVAGSFTAPINSGGPGEDEVWTGTGLTAGATYYLRIDGDAGSTGDYTLDVQGPSPWPEWPAHPFTGSAYENTIYVNQMGEATLTGKSLAAGDFDGYEVFWDDWDMSAAATVQTTGSTDTLLAYYDPSGSSPDLIDDESGTGSNALLNASAAQWNAVGFCVSGHGEWTTGEYGLVVDGPQPEGTEYLSIGENRHGSRSDEIRHAWNYDFHIIETTAAGDWTVRVSPAGSWDPTLLVFDDAGNPVAGSFTAPINAAGPGEDEVWTGTGLADGAVYYLRIDGFGDSVGGYTVDVQGPPLEAVEDVYLTDENTPLVVDADQGVLKNDDAGGDGLQVECVEGPFHGDLMLDPSGAFTYTPQAGFHGADSFAYRIHDGSDFSNAATATIRVTRPLGMVDFAEWPGQELPDEEVWYRCRAAAARFLTLEAIVPLDPGSVQIEMFDANLGSLGLSALRYGNQRIEHIADARGDAYFFRVAGTAARFDLRATNLVALAGEKMTVAGTKADDRFEFIAGAGTRVIIRGVRYDVPGYATRISFDGGDGPDTAVLRGSSSDETVSLSPDSGTYSGKGLTVQVARTSNITAYSGSGNDVGRLYGLTTAAADKASLSPTLAGMTGTGYSNQLRGFRTVTAYGRGGGNDEARCYDSAGSDTFYGYPTYAVMSGAAFTNRAIGFAKVYAYATALNAPGAVDRACLYDSAAASTSFYGYSTHAWITGAGFYHFARGFDRVYAYATAADAAGAIDRAYLYDSAGNDRFYASSIYASLAGTGFFNYARGFDRVYGYATSGHAAGGQDQARLCDCAGEDFFYAADDYAFLHDVAMASYNRVRGFNRVIADGTAGGVNHLAKVGPLDYVLQQTGSWT